MAKEYTLETMPLDKAIELLQNEDVVTSNGQLKDALQTVLNEHPAAKKSDINVLAYDNFDINADYLSMARQIAHDLGGTAIIRTPNFVSVASEDFPRAAIAKGEQDYLEHVREPVVSLNALLDDLGSYSVPWTIYSLIVGAIIIAIFVALTAYWIKRPTTKTTKSR